MATNWRVGDHIQGRWEIYRVLQGGAGIVYIVYDHAFREPFAAKTFRDEVVALNPVVADRFEREGLAWIQLDLHPNVAQARMVEKIEGKPFLFLEYVSGGDLGGWIGSPRLTQDLPQVLRFAVQFCDGMIYIASKNIRAHRDIKPRNCLITTDGILKITDFGLAKLSNEEVLSVASSAGGPSGTGLTVAAIGTCTHMAPEQFERAAEVDSRADTYAFGVMLYEMVKGDLPFVADTWQEFEDLHRSEPAPYLQGVHKPFADMVQACLEKDPRNRPADFTQVRAKLAEIFKAVLGVAPPEPPKDSALTAIQCNNKGSSLDNLGRREEALRCYELALQLDPFLVPAWLNKGIALFSSGKQQEALGCYEKGLSLDPHSEQLWSNKGVVLKSLGDTGRAVECYDRSIHCNPRYPNAWVNKGVALKSTGKLKEALECYQHALALNPADINALTNKGNLLYAMRRHSEALKCYDAALKINSNLGLTWLNKGMALSALGRHEEALHSYGMAIETGPRLEQAWFLMAVTMINEFKQYREAVPYLEEADRLGVKQAAEVLIACRAATLEKTR